MISVVIGEEKYYSCVSLNNIKRTDTLGIRLVKVNYIIFLILLYFISLTFNLFFFLVRFVSFSFCVSFQVSFFRYEEKFLPLKERLKHRDWAGLTQAIQKFWT